MLIAALLLLLPPSALAQEKPRLRGLCVVDSRVAWASGTAGTVLRTIDGGLSWERRPVPGAEALDFRDVQAFDDRTAFALSIGPGEQSRITRRPTAARRGPRATSTATPRASSTPSPSGTLSTASRSATRSTAAS